MEQLPGLDTAEARPPGGRRLVLRSCNIYYICGFKYICGVSNSPARMEQLPGLDTAARMEQLPGWNNYLGSNLRPQTTRAVTLPIELRGASTIESKTKQL